VPTAHRLRILLLTSEMAPFAKTGGLADVAASLPRALARLGHDVRVLMPRYRGVDRFAGELRVVVPDIRVPLGDRMVEGALWAGRAPSGVPVYFLANDHYYHREELYGTADGDYWDNCERFVFFCRGALEALIRLAGGEGTERRWRPQVVHANDWQTGLLPVYLRTLYRDVPSLRPLGALFTIHNLAYQGTFWHYDMPMTGLGWDLFTPAGLEFYGKLSFLKGGLVFSDVLTTVSQSYAREIRTAEHGHGLDGVLEERSADLHGIVNGLDGDLWDPAGDPAIEKSYSAERPEGRIECRAALQRALGLEASSGPIAGIVSRMAAQKGLDLVLAALPELLAEDCQLAVLGSGDAPIEEAFAAAAARYPGRVSVTLGYRDDLARRIYAGADLFLMPSRYEPCGLSQLIALRYGCIPVARRTGGLADTVVDFDPVARSGTGFLFDDFSVDDLLGAVRRAIAAHRDAEGWSALIGNAMRQDFSWDASARHYVTLYRKAIRAHASRP
jgi:starch synthase